MLINPFVHDFLWPERSNLHSNFWVESQDSQCTSQVGLIDMAPMKDKVCHQCVYVCEGMSSMSCHYTEPGRAHVYTCILNEKVNRYCVVTLVTAILATTLPTNRKRKIQTHKFTVWGAWDCVPDLPHFNTYLLRLVINQLWVMSFQSGWDVCQNILRSWGCIY